MNHEERAAYDEALRKIENCRFWLFRKRKTELNLSSLGLTQLPPEIGLLKTLTRLDLSKNKLTSLPDTIEKLTALKRLDLSSNALESLPSQIGQMKALMELSVGKNRLTALPPEIAELSNLKQLLLNTNALPRFPAEICELTGLMDLSLRTNRIVTLPREIGQLTQLTRLDVSNNQLSELPLQIGGLLSLTRLRISGNRLKGLPSQIGSLSALELLTAERNQLFELPETMRRLKNLQELTLHSNDALGIPPELLGPTYADSSDIKRASNPKAILDYYFARLEQGEAPMQEVRLLLVGRGRVGKTSLLKALLGEKPNPEEPETPGITVVPLPLECAQGTATAHAWDFGGQEFLHGTHQIFLSERCVYLLVLEGRESNWESETDYWLRFIQSFGGDSPVAVALNKYDLHKFTVDRFRLQERCPQIMGFVETDAFSGRGIPELRTLLETTVNGMRGVWLGVAKSWLRVKGKLSQMPENFLDYGTYQALCKSEGVVEEALQGSLAATLHELGIALNFRDHHRLKETSVLKPQWVTEGIYGLLRYAQDQDCKGVLERSWLAQALPAAQYPPEKHPFVMELMEKFEVAFALEEKDSAEQTERWLIPELLPENQPQPFAEFRAVGVKRLRFTYPEALPPGLLPRFIVRTHGLSTGQARWRSGVVLVWGSSRALVRLDRAQRQATVEVLGASQEAAQGLFDTIRAHLTVLHGKVPAVEEVQVSEEPVKWVPMTDLRVAERTHDESLKVTIGVGAQAQQIELPVVKTLNKVESPEARAAEGPTPPQRMRLFVSYAHADTRRIKPLSTHLTILGQRGYIQAWDDRQLIAGQEWEEKIMEELRAADLVLLIYSTAARRSPFMQEKEIPFALAQSRDMKCVIMPVPLDRKDWDESVVIERELKKRQAATWNARPVLKFTPQRDGWLEVEHEVRKAVEAWRKDAR